MNSTTSGQVLREIHGGVLVGTAVGDTLGLPAENLSPESIQRCWKGGWQMRLVFDRGMISTLNCGGDTDTVGAIVGAMIGASVGEKGIPTEWRHGECSMRIGRAML
jgi:ADP-ribosylglycohydrolase